MARLHGEPRGRSEGRNQVRESQRRETVWWINQESRAEPPSTACYSHLPGGPWEIRQTQARGRVWLSSYETLEVGMNLETK